MMVSVSRLQARKTTVVCGEGVQNIVAWFATAELAQQFVEDMQRKWKEFEMPDEPTFVERRKGGAP